MYAFHSFGTHNIYAFANTLMPLTSRILHFRFCYKELGSKARCQVSPVTHTLSPPDKGTSQSSNVVSSHAETSAQVCTSTLAYTHASPGIEVMISYCKKTGDALCVSGTRSLRSTFRWSESCYTQQ